MHSPIFNAANVSTTRKKIGKAELLAVEAKNLLAYPLRKSIECGGTGCKGLK
jgi:hypothetical protein